MLLYEWLSLEFSNAALVADVAAVAVVASVVAAEAENSKGIVG